MEQKGLTGSLLKNEVFAPFFIGSVYQYLHQVYIAFFGPSCRFTPSCSSYAKEALSEYGIRKGLWLSVMKLLGVIHLVEGL